MLFLRTEVDLDTFLKFVFGRASAKAEPQMSTPRSTLPPPIPCEKCQARFRIGAWNVVDLGKVSRIITPVIATMLA